MTPNNVSALLNMYRMKGVISARTHTGQIVFYGLRSIPKGQREQLLSIPQIDLDAAMKRQGL